MVEATFVISLLVMVLASVGVALSIVQMRRSDGRQLEGSLRSELTASRNETNSELRLLREGASNGAQSTRASLDHLRDTLDARLDEARGTNERTLSGIRDLVDNKLQTTLDGLSKDTSGVLSEMRTSQQQHSADVLQQLKALSDSTNASLERVRGTIDSRARDLQDSNDRKLDEMRRTVDEKLHTTLERRLGDSFKLISDRLEAVHRGLGEMQSLATGVGDLKRVLTNVKTRGTWAEIQLAAILEQILAPSQYEKNVQTRDDSSQSVEYAVRLPGPRDDRGACVWLPIDSKFPQEDYLRLQEAAERADADALAKAADGLARAVRSAAQEIRDKYVNPPKTTDFAIMYLATEGLYAEVLRQPALAEELQQRYRIVIAGPTTLAAILNSLRMGFQTLAIEQRAAEVWSVLAAVKTEFGKFGDVLDKVKRQLSTAARTIDETGRRTRAMERRLQTVEQLPEDDAIRVLRIPSDIDDGAGCDVDSTQSVEETEASV